MSNTVNVALYSALGIGIVIVWAYAVRTPTWKSWAYWNRDVSMRKQKEET